MWSKISYRLKEGISIDLLHRLYCEAIVCRSQINFTEFCTSFIRAIYYKIKVGINSNEQLNEINIGKWCVAESRNLVRKWLINIMMYKLNLMEI